MSEADNEFDPRSALLSAMEDRIRLLETELSTSGEQHRIIQDLEACESLRQKMIDSWKHLDAPSYPRRTLH